MEIGLAKALAKELMGLLRTRLTTKRPAYFRFSWAPGKLLKIRIPLRKKGKYSRWQKLIAVRSSPPSQCGLWTAIPSGTLTSGRDEKNEVPLETKFENDERARGS